MALNLQAENKENVINTDLKVEYSDCSTTVTPLPLPEYGDNEANQFQYHEVYKHRLRMLRPRLERAAEEKFPGVNVKTLNHMAIDEEAVVIGIFIKVIKLQPEVLDEYLEDLDKPTPPNKLSDEDVLGFEDETQRTKVTGLTIAKTREIVTGQCVSILGRITKTGDFEIMDWASPETAKKINEKVEKSMNIGFAGDFRFGADNCASNIELELLAYFITSMAGEENEQQNKISRFNVAGIAAIGNDSQRTKTGRFETGQITQAYREADLFLSSISKFIPLDVFTGFGDCGSLKLPSPALHKVMFPKTREGCIRCYPSPISYSIAGTYILNVTELVINKMKEYSNLKNPVDILERLIKVSHVVPISPDIIAGAPFQETDPYVIERLPDAVWCIGDKFEERIVKVGSESVLLFSVPSFAKTKSIVIMKTKADKNDISKLQLVQLAVPFNS